MARRTIILLGQPVYNEDGAAGEAIKPGHLVQGVTTILKHATAGGKTPTAFALERDELGRGIDDTLNVGHGSADYAIGDTVKVGVFTKGQRVLAFIASGQNITADMQLESAGNGTLRTLAAGQVLARALESSGGAVVTLTRIRVEIM